MIRVTLHLFIGLLSATSLAISLAARADGHPEALAAYHQQNYREAMRLFRPLAEQGDPQAQYYIGRMYEKGEGVHKDPDQVRRWYRRSAEAGYAPAQYRMAVGYAYGLAGLPRDHGEAVKWLRKSGEGGYKRAQKELGRAYAGGRLGLPVDEQQAEYWTKKAETGS